MMFGLSKAEKYEKEYWSEKDRAIEIDTKILCDMIFRTQDGCIKWECVKKTSPLKAIFRTTDHMAPDGCRSGFQIELYLLRDHEFQNEPKVFCRIIKDNKFSYFPDRCGWRDLASTVCRKLNVYDEFFYSDHLVKELRQEMEDHFYG